MHLFDILLFYSVAFGTMFALDLVTRTSNFTKIILGGAAGALVMWKTWPEDGYFLAQHDASQERQRREFLAAEVHALERKLFKARAEYREALGEEEDE